ncbi:MAG TPA: 4Fe-4S binding protein [Anaerolineales bacterium]|jgi:NAD-dependent dihydropyrimidine dehydrogenase PreA subunit|nr:4Fe-4S binding protein [Anaerolineales bacterium]
MTYIITSLCLRDSSCVDVCPVECIVPGKPVEKWPWFYIDPDTCIDCGACVPECPFEAIFPEDEVPVSYEARGGETISMPADTPGYDTVYDGEDEHGEPVHLEYTRILEPGEIVDLTRDNPPNYHYFGVDHPDDEGEVEYGPGYDALDM